jgi:hypothetical protein
VPAGFALFKSSAVNYLDIEEGPGMKEFLCTSLVLLAGMMLTVVIWASDKQEIEKQIKNQVDEVITAIDGGKKEEDFKILAKKEPYYVFIMEQTGKFLIHPNSASFNLKTKSDQEVYDALVKGTTEGLWVEYPLYAKKKRVYVKKAKGGLFVASGYND